MIRKLCLCSTNTDLFNANNEHTAGY